MKIKKSKELRLIHQSPETEISSHELRLLRRVENGFKSSEISTLLTNIWAKGSIKHLSLADQIEMLYLDSLNKKAKNKGISKIPFIKQGFIDWLEEIYKREQILHPEKWLYENLLEFVSSYPSYKKKSLLADRTRFSQFLLLQKLLFWGELERSLPNKRLNRLKNRVDKKALHLVLQSIKKLPRESAVLGKGLAEVTVGFELEHQNNLDRYMHTYLESIYALNNSSNVKIDRKLLENKVKKASIPLVKIFGSDLSFIKFGLFGNNIENFCDNDPEYAYFNKDVTKRAFTGVSEHLGFLVNKVEPGIEEVYALPALNPLLAYHDIQTIASSQVVENRGSLHMRLMGFPFQGANLIATEGLVFALGGGLIPSKNYHTGVLMENAMKSFEIDLNHSKTSIEDFKMFGSYVPFHLPINKPPDSSLLMQYPRLKIKSGNIEGFELRGFPVFRGKNEFDQFETAVEFEYFIVQGTIAHTVKIKTPAQKKLAKIFEWFIQQRDQVMKEARIYIPALDERYVVFGDFEPCEEEVSNNLYTIYLSEVNKKSKSDHIFRGKLNKIALTYLSAAKKVTNIELRR